MEPGDVFKSFSAALNENGEKKFDEILAEISQKIIPNMYHWRQSYETCETLKMFQIFIFFQISWFFIEISKPISKVISNSNLSHPDNIAWFPNLMPRIFTLGAMLENALNCVDAVFRTCPFLAQISDSKYMIFCSCRFDNDAVFYVVIISVQDSGQGLTFFI